MTEKKLEDCKTGAVIGAIVGVGTAFVALPLMLLTGPRGGGEILKGIVKGCSKLGAHIEKKLNED